jgi:ribosome-associated protein
LTSRTLAKKVAEFALSKKASDVILMDLRKLNAPADFFVLCSADSDTHAKAIAQAVRNGTDEIGVELWRSEGFRALSWVLLDYVDVVVHVFKKEVRQFYNLERLWGDAKVTGVEDKLSVLHAAAPSRSPSRPGKPPRRAKKDPS